MSGCYFHWQWVGGPLCWHGGWSKQRQRLDLLLCGSTSNLPFDRQADPQRRVSVTWRLQHLLLSWSVACAREGLFPPLLSAEFPHIDPLHLGKVWRKRFAPNASTTSFRALQVFTRDKLNNSHSVQAHQHPLLPAGAPGTAGKDNPKAERCARHPLISQGFKSEQNTQAFACWCFLPIQIWNRRMRAQEPWSHQALQNLRSEKLAFNQQAALAYPG